MRLTNSGARLCLATARHDARGSRKAARNPKLPFPADSVERYDESGSTEEPEELDELEEPAEPPDADAEEEAEEVLDRELEQAAASASASAAAAASA